MAIETIRIIATEVGVLVLRNGQVVLDMPVEQALAVSDAIKHQAHRTETYQRYCDENQRSQLEQDQRLLNRSGIPLNLGVPRDQMAKLGAIGSREKLGMPGVLQNLTAEQRIQRMKPVELEALKKRLNGAL